MSVREGSDTPRARQTVQIEARVGRRASLECFEVAPGTGSGVAVDHGREEPVRQPRMEARARARVRRDAMAYHSTLVALRTSGRVQSFSHTSLRVFRARGGPRSYISQSVSYFTVPPLFYCSAACCATALSHIGRIVAHITVRRFLRLGLRGRGGIYAETCVYARGCVYTPAVYTHLPH